MQGREATASRLWRLYTLTNQVCVFRCEAGNYFKINYMELLIFLSSNSFIANLEVSGPTMAFWPLLLLGGLLVGGAVIIIANSTETTTTQGKSIGILGMQESGKTSLLNILRRVAYNQYTATNVDAYKDFDCEINGKSYRIKSGADIGGDELYIPKYYRDLIPTYDIIFFIFNVNKYLKSIKYMTETNARLEFVHRHLLEKYKTEASIKKHLVVIGSHMDNLSESEQKNALSRCQNSIKFKTYSMMFNNNFMLLDLTKPGKVRSMFAEKSIFE